MNHLVETVEKAAQSLVTWSVVGIASGLVWIVRRVFTNQKQIELLQAHLESRDEMRQRDRDDLQEVKKEVKEINRNVMTLFQDRK